MVSAVWCGLEVFVQNFDEVAWEETYRPRISSEPTHPPEAVARIERLNQVALDEAQVFLCLSTP